VATLPENDAAMLSSDAALSAFDSETQPARPARRPGTPAKPIVVNRWVLVAGFLAVVAVTAGVAFLAMRTPPANAGAAGPVDAAPVAPTTGSISIQTTPPGVEVVIAGQSRGITPVALSLDAGHYDVILRRGTEERSVPIDVPAGTSIVQRVEFAAAAATSAKLSVVTDPSGARVSVDGQPRGVSPITIADVSAGRHRVTVSNGVSTAERTVTAESGATTSVVFSLAGLPGMEVGWLTVSSPFEVKVVERDDVVGTSASSRIIVPAGAHEFDLVNSELGYQTHRRVLIEAGKTSDLRIEARASLNVNARPWAEVLIDGTPMGTTPIANISLPLGSHQVVFRHPDLGERRQEVVVTLQGPNRIAADMTSR
jgi:hypothetical protein